MAIFITEENKEMANVIESQFPFDKDRKEQLLRDLCVPLSMSDFFYEVLSLLILEDLSMLYLKYGDELQLKAIAEIIGKTKEQTRSMYSDLIKRVSKIYQGVMWGKILEDGFFRQTNIYVSLSAIYDKRRRKLSSEAEVIMTKMANTGAMFFYFWDEKLSPEEKLSVQNDLSEHAKRLPSCGFDEWHMPHFIIETEKSNFLLKNFPGIVVSAYHYAEMRTKEDRLEHYFTFK